MALPNVSSLTLLRGLDQCPTDNLKTSSTSKHPVALGDTFALVFVDAALRIDGQIDVEVHTMSDASDLERNFALGLL
jgi:hypothetical protein